MKKFLVITICLCTVAAFARGPHHGRHHHHRGHDGVWLAAGITSIVANGIGILNAVSLPRYVASAPVVTTPVVVPQTAYPQSEYIQPQVDYIVLDNEGLLCTSSAQSTTEKLKEIYGTW